MGIFARSALVIIVIFAGCAKPAPQSRRELATFRLAEFLQTNSRPKSVIVLSNPFAAQPGRPAEVYEFEEAGLAGLHRGFGPEVAIQVERPELSPEVLRDPASVPVDPKTITPLSFLVPAQSFSAAIAKHPGSDLVISLIGLPLRLDSLKEWTQPDGPGFALLLPDWRMIGGRDEIVDAFKSGRIVAAVVNRPNAASIPARDREEDFDTHFLLVTADNVAALIEAHPSTFQLE